MNQHWIKQVGFEYSEFLLYSVAPATVPVAIVGAADGVSFFDRQAFLLFVGAEQLFLLAVGLCGTLMLRTTRIERAQDRRVMHGPLIFVLLAAAIGLGLATAGFGENPDFLVQFAGALVVALVAFGGTGTAVLANLNERRRPTIDLRDRTPSEVAVDLAHIIHVDPEIGAILDNIRHGTPSPDSPEENK